MLSSVISSVPQVTVLGPILFLIYINDLPDCIHHNTIRLFANDSILYRPISSITDTNLLQQDSGDILANVCKTIATLLNLSVPLFQNDSYVHYMYQLPSYVATHICIWAGIKKPSCDPVVEDSKVGLMTSFTFIK